MTGFVTHPCTVNLCALHGKSSPPHPAHAGRVQSVALRLIAEREAEREAFKPDEWWTVDPLLTNANGKPFRVSVRSACPSAAAYVAL